MEAEPPGDPSPAPSPNLKGFKAVVAKAKLRKDDSSPNSPAATDDSSGRTGIRNSIDSLVRNSTRSSVDDGLPSGPSNMSKLIPGRVKKKKRQREEAERQQRIGEEYRGRSLVDQAATSATRTQLASVNRSKSSLAGSEGNSLTTLESDLDS